jgi:AP2 domain
MAVIYVHNSEVWAIINNEDYGKVSARKWYLQRKISRQGYAVTYINRYPVEMGKFILGIDGTVDHIDGDTFNNQRHNLRTATTQQNRANSKKVAKAASRFKGVFLSNNGKKWRAHIKFEGKQTHLGTFDSEEDAAKAYDRAAKDLFGEYARTNF